MSDDAPLAQLVLWVPPAVAAGWERLAPDSQALWTRRIVRNWLELITQPGPPPVLLNLRNLLPAEDYEGLRRDLDAIPRISPPPPDLPPLPEVLPAPAPPPFYPRLPQTDEERAQQWAYHEASMRHMESVTAMLEAMNARHDARFGKAKESTP